MSTALKSRMAHINLDINAEDWIDWAYSAGIDETIIAYINFENAALYDFNPNADTDTFPAPRTWAMVDKIIKQVGINSPLCQDMVAATVSDAAAIKFMAYTQNFTNLPTFEQMMKDPTGVKLPSYNEPGAIWAITTILAGRATLENATNVWTVLMRLPQEYIYAGFLQAIRRSAVLIANPQIQAWAKEFAPQLTAK